MSSFDVVCDCHRSSRYFVVLVVEEENKGDGLRRSPCMWFDLLHSDVSRLTVAGE